VKFSETDILVLALVHYFEWEARVYTVQQLSEITGLKESEIEDSLKKLRAAKRIKSVKEMKKKYGVSL